MEGERYLKSLEVKGHELAFLIESNDVFYYTCEIEGGSGWIEISARPSESKYILSGDCGVFPVEKGVNTFRLVVSEAGESVKTFEISAVVKDNKSNTSLKRVLVDEEDAEMIMEKGTFLHYFFHVPEDREEVEIEPVPENIKSEIEGDCGKLQLSPGLNNFLIEVVSEDHQKRENYLLIVEREEPKAETNPQPQPIDESDDLKPQPIDEPGYLKLQPIDKPDDLKPQPIDEPDYLKPQPIDEPDYLKPQPIDEPDYLKPQPIDQSDYSEPQPIDESDHPKPQPIDESVQKPDDEPEQVEKTFEINLRETQNVLEEKRLPRLKSLTVSSGVLIPEFDPEIMEYSIEIDDDIEQITIDAVSETDGNQLDGDLGENELVSGSNMFYISCFTEDRLQNSVYKLRLDKKRAALPENVYGNKGKKHHQTKKNNIKNKLLMEQVKQSLLPQKGKKMRVRDKVAATFLLMSSLTYLSYSVVVSPIMREASSISQKLLETSQRRTTVENYLQREGQLQEELTVSQEKIKEFADKYPQLPSQEEILQFLDYLNSRITFEYTSVSVSASEPVTLEDIRMNVRDKKLEELVVNVDEIIPPLSEKGNEITETRESGVIGDTTVREHLMMNTASIVVQGRYEDMLQLYDLIYKEDRNILLDNIMFNRISGYTISQAEGDIWELSFDMIFYYYTGAAAADQ